MLRLQIILFFHTIGLKAYNWVEKDEFVGQIILLVITTDLLLVICYAITHNLKKNCMVQYTGKPPT